MLAIGLKVQLGLSAKVYSSEFAELKLQGKSAEEAMPLVKDHLDKCGECREEFHALLEAMKSLYEKG